MMPLTINAYDVQCPGPKYDGAQPSYFGPVLSYLLIVHSTHRTCLQFIQPVALAGICFSGLLGEGAI